MVDQTEKHSGLLPDLQFPRANNSNAKFAIVDNIAIIAAISILTLGTAYSNTHPKNSSSLRQP